MNILISLVANQALMSLCAGFILRLFAKISLPKVFSSLIALYLVFAIGLKGGMCLGTIEACSSFRLSVILIALAIGFVQPFLNYIIISLMKSIGRQTAIVIATQYGSISIVTFVMATTFLMQQAVVYDTAMSALAGLMEIPALFSGLILLKSIQSHQRGLWRSLMHTALEIIRTPKITIIFVGFFFGYLLNMYSLDALAAWALWPFTAILILFMFDIGISIAEQRSHIHHITWSLIAFGIYMPIVYGLLGVALSYAMALSAGTALLFSMLLASASYIVVPAIMRSQAYKAKEAVYLPMAIAITLPFNVVVNTPLMYYCIMKIW